MFGRKIAETEMSPATAELIADAPKISNRRLQMIDHYGSEYWDIKSGTRVLLLKGRKKDGVTDERSLTRISHNADEWERKVDEMCEIAKPGERIYCTAAPRNLAKAMRNFKEAQLNAEYDKFPEEFYKRLNARWSSALMKPNAAEYKVWLFDCDDETERLKAAHWIKEMQAISDFDIKPYGYNSKSGYHYLTRPFNKSMLPGDVRSLIHDNALALVAY